ncbi:MAG: Uma2 family endonuclease [Pirellula sp.]|jgi:Uma2 family endonuclease|nr:Uma2 family endonuclease [Pirellula sp.]
MSVVERVVSEPETRMVLEGVEWETYVALSDQRRGSVPRMTYDNGVLEMMSPNREHESIGRLVGRLIETYSEVKNIEIISVGSVTVKRSDLSKAFEADESYYVSNAERLLSKKDLDFSIDPPPDLVVDVEMTSSAINTLQLFAAMGVPEVWRHDGHHLQMFELVDGSYLQIRSSFQLPGLTTVQVDELLSQRNTVGETKLIQNFRMSISS